MPSTDNPGSGYSDLIKLDGPFSPADTKRAAEAIAELVRYLNHATIRNQGALEYPNDVDIVLADLAIAAERLPQLLGQISAWLQDECAAGRIGVDKGSTLEAVTNAGLWLMRAAEKAAEVSRALDQAHQFTATMSGTGEER